jgi:hypothetical protein
VEVTLEFRQGNFRRKGAHLLLQFPAAVIRSLAAGETLLVESAGLAENAHTQFIYI